MTRFYIIIFSVTFSLSFLNGQIEWEEHLSHDRRAYDHLGHYIIDGDIVLLMGNQNTPMNTLEVIKGNSKKDQEIISNYFTFRKKTTRTGINSKEILLIDAFEYDIPGFGTYSIHKVDNDFNIRDIYADSNFDDVEFYTINDAHLLGSPTDSKQCITYDTRYYLDEDDMITFQQSTEGSLKFHEGLDGDAYQIWNGLFRRINPPANGVIDLEDYDALYNNPFDNQLVVRKENNLTRYSYENLAFVNTDILLAHPIDIQFIENGFYYLTQTDDSYIIYHYSDQNADSELFYELPKTDEIAEFRISNFEVVDEDIYFFGLWKSPLIKQFFSYVQKRTLNKEFNPIRKDIELENATATRENINNNQFKYNYTITVKNLSEDTIRHFTSYTDLSFDFLPARFHKTDVSLLLPPGEIEEVHGEFTSYGYYGLNKMTFEIEGVDFGIDSDVSNNSYTADVISLSNKNQVINHFSISPNASMDFIALNGATEEIKTLYISNIRGHKIDLSTRDYQNIDISMLPKGKYWLEIKTKSRLEQHPFIKL